MDTNISKNGTRDLVLTGLVIVVVIYLAPIIVKSSLAIGAGMVNAVYKRYGKCYEATVQYEDGTEETIKVTRKEAKEMGLLEE